MLVNIFDKNYFGKSQIDSKKNIFVILSKFSPLIVGSVTLIILMKVKSDYNKLFYKESTKMKIKKILCLILCVLLSLSVMFTLVACDNENENQNNGGVSSNKNPRPDHNNYTTINLNSYFGGVGVEWLYKALTRFQEKYAEYEFEPGKKGIYIDVSLDSSEDMSQKLDSSNYHVVIDERHTNIYDLGANGYILPIDDVIKGTAYGESIESRLSADVIDALKGVDGHYYALPNYEIFPGLSYDREAFLEERWYLAKDAQNGQLYKFKGRSEVIQGYFINSPTSERSCGPDGVYGTEDDGLPSSLEELMLVCDRVTRSGYPLTFSGQWSQNCNYLIQGLWAALAGYDEIQTVYTYAGQVEVVTGVSTEPLFDGIDYVFKPITETVTITEENGYLAHSSVARYYTAAFMKIAQQEGWFSPDSTGSTGNVDAMANFIMNKYSKEGKRRAFLIEGNYWYNEITIDSDWIEKYEKTYKKSPDVAVMPLPSTLRTSDITPSTDKADAIPYTQMDNAVCYIYLNAKFKDDENHIKASKMLMEFLLSHDENVLFTQDTGLTRPLNYTLTDEQVSSMSLFHQSNYAIKQNSRVLYNSSSSSIFKNNCMALQISFSSSWMRPFSSPSYFEAFRTEGKTVWDVFQNKQMSQSLWNQYKSK